MKREKTTQFVTASALLAVLVVLTATGWGFIMTGPVSITILHIPVIIGSLLLGPRYGLALGVGFGLLSMINATFRGVLPTDLAFSPFASNHPFRSILLSVGPRAVLGILPYWLQKGLNALVQKLAGKKWAGRKRLTLTISVTGILTFMVLGLFYLLFPEVSQITGLKQILGVIIATNGLIEMAVAGILSAAIVVPLLYYSHNRT